MSATVTIKPSLDWLDPIVEPKPRKASPVTKSPPKHLRKLIIHREEQLDHIPEPEPVLNKQMFIDAMNDIREHGPYINRKSSAMGQTDRYYPDLIGAI